MLFIFSIIGYILVVLKEKFFLKQNIILIDNKHLTQEDLDETDINEFIYRGTRVKSGDEIKLVTRENKKNQWNNYWCKEKGRSHPYNHP